MRLLRLDHVDFRVRSIAAVEAFYDTLLPKLGLSRKTESHVGADGEWYDVDPDRPRNAVEYHTPSEPDLLGWFVGFIEDGSEPSATRVAFTLDSEASLVPLEEHLRAAGACRVEWSIEEPYPALFFEDPVGTRLEICARRPRK